MTTIADQWNLDALFRGLDDPELASATQALSAKMTEIPALLERSEDASFLPDAIRFIEETRLESSRIGGFLSLLSSADTRNTQVRGLLQNLQRTLTPMTLLSTRLKQSLQAIDDLPAYLEQHPELQAYRYLLERLKQEAEHTLSEEVEEMITLMNPSAGGSWSQLFRTLTSTLEVDWTNDSGETETVNLSTIRNFANDPSPQIRQRAYQAELAAYPKIEASIAAALNSIKTQVNMLADKRGFASALDMTMLDNRMERQTLDVLIGAMEENRTILHRFMRAKARLLGHESALPWWDIIAPVGKNDQTYTIEEARDLLLEVFTPLSEDIAGIMKRSFDEAWIDIYPRPGKVGGAFCSFQPSLKESRMLTNFNGSFDAISTLAHELGHAYHGYTIKDHKPLNQSYSMPVAETASTFNETHLTLHMYERASTSEEKLAILDNYLTGAGQTIVDILSRFTFEKNVFEAVKDRFLDAENLKTIMLDAQAFAYGDAVQEEARHPYMWACKGHYYSTGLSYYNFPYAFGQLFSLGLYRRYQTEGASFMPTYAKLLHDTGLGSVEDTARSASIDLSKPDFWNESFQVIAELVDAYEALVEKL